MATGCFLLGELPLAAYHFKEVTRLDPQRTGAFINLGAVYNRLEQFDDAIPALRRGIQLDTNRAEGYYNLGLVYRRKGQPDMAIQAYREATRINPRMANAHFNIANIYLEKGTIPAWPSPIIARPSKSARRGKRPCAAWSKQKQPSRNIRAPHCLTWRIWDQKVPSSLRSRHPPTSIGRSTRYCTANYCARCTV